MPATGSYAIAKTRPADAGLDQQQLYTIGLDYVRQLAGHVWTDHNVHDPGITILELLTYALTDLTHRASQPDEDLLSGAAFFSAAGILPNHPLTALDYRKLIIDVEGVKNAWLEPVAQQYFADTKTGEILVDNPNRPEIETFAVKGLWRVRLDYADDKRTATDRAGVNSAVMAHLHQHRNLAEDFVEVTGVERQAFVMCGEIDLAPGADIETVHATILQQVQEYLSPSVRWYTLDEMFARRKADGTAFTVPDVFDGPRLQHGFIDSDELAAADLRKNIRLSDIVSLVMDIDGVVAVRDLLIAPVRRKGQPLEVENRWVVPVEAGKAATLNQRASRIVYYKRHMPFVGPELTVNPKTAPPSVRMEDVPIPTGPSRDVKSYYPFQHHFPALYGIGDHPPAKTGDAAADTRRRALASQLKGYLLFFDQVMANYCAQLAEVAQLFSTNPAIKATYFSQVVTGLPEFAALYGMEGKDAATVADALPGIETEADRTDRRRRFLDHLIARFAERFHEYASMMRSAFGATDASLVADRCAFLNDYPSVGANRSRAWNHTLTDAGDLWKSAKVSGLEDRVARLIGIGNNTRRDLTSVEPGDDVDVSGDAANQFRFTLKDRDAGSVLLREDERHATADLARAQLQRAFELGQRPSAYSTARENNKHIFRIAAGNGEVVARSPDFASAAERDTAMIELRTYLRRHYSREGMYVIENILLRPQKAGDQGLHYCVDESCPDCVEDPYSYRIHVVLPAYAGRFNDMPFRRFVEDVIREETPAHILPKVCWIGEADMERFQKAYRVWLQARAGGNATAALKHLVELLMTVKNVYPAQKLTDCAEPREVDKFILGRGALGTRNQ